MYLLYNEFVATPITVIITGIKEACSVVLNSATLLMTEYF